MYKIQVGNYLLDVDFATYQSLQDPEYAANYLKQIEIQFGNENSENVPSNSSLTSDSSKLVWTSAKKATDQDIQACYAFLSLRKSLSDRFEDKKNNKNALWLEIATKLNEMGFFVGDGILGREKCRQKFMNLQHSHMKYKDQIRQTGEGFIKKTPFFDEVDDILGDKHKSNPEFVLDSSRSSTYTQESGIELDTEDPTKPSTSQESIPRRNKFQMIKKSVRPKKTVLNTVENIIKEDRTLRAQQFKELIEAVKVQNQQRHEQTMGIIEI